LEPAEQPDPMAPAAHEAACGMVTTDTKGLVLWVNATFCSWLGLSAEALVGRKKLQDLLTIGGRIFHQTHWAPLLQLQGSVAEVKLDFVDAQGRLVPMVLNALVRERQGTRVNDLALFVARDRDAYEHELLSSRAKLEELVARSARQEEAARDRASYAEQMVGIVSHDLRNPLSAVHLGVQALRKMAPDEGQRRVIDRIARSTDRAHRLISELLDFTAARLGSGIPVTPRPTDLHAVVGDAVAELGVAFPGRGLRHVKQGDGQPVVDADRIAQLVGNLVGNAMAYGDAGRDVTVTSRIEGARVCVAVHNHGAPIPADILPGLFVPMVRGVTGGADRSVGLGLYIVCEIARAHGGTVAVTSTDAEGTEFRVTLPDPAPSRHRNAGSM